MIIASAEDPSNAAVADGREPPTGERDVGMGA